MTFGVGQQKKLENLVDNTWPRIRLDEMRINNDILVNAAYNQLENPIEDTRLIAFGGASVALEDALFAVIEDPQYSKFERLSIIDAVDNYLDYFRDVIVMNVRDRCVGTEP